MLCPRQPIVGVAVSAAVGIAAADWWETPLAWTVAAALCVGALTLWRPRTATAWLLTAVSFFTLHTARHHGSAARLLSTEFADGPRVLRAEGVVWSEPEKPAHWSRRTTCRFLLKTDAITCNGAERRVGVLLQVRWAGTEIPAYGDRVTLTGSVENLPPPRNPAQFDFARYQHRNGVYSSLEARYATDCRILQHGCGNPAQAFAIRSQRWIERQLQLDLADSPEIASLIGSMVLGLRGDAPDEMKELFQHTGTFHLFAVSGLNVAMLAGIAWFVLKAFRVSRRAAIALTIPLLACYALATGLSASCVRATVMCSLVLAAYVADRRALPFNGLAAAAVGILAWDTNQLFSPGFQFSFLLVAVLAGFASRFQRLLDPWGQPDPFLPQPLWTWRQRMQSVAWRAAAGSLAVSFTSWFGSMAFTAGYFHLFSLSTVAANLLAVPISFFILCLGVAAVIGGAIHPHLAVLFNNANWALAKGLLLWVGAMAEMPASHVYVGAPQFHARPVCEITVLDLGEGGAIHIRADGEDWLIDCGHGFEYERIVSPYLRSRGVNALSGLILTHGDTQHIGAASEALRDFQPETVVDSPLKDRSSGRRAFQTELARQNRGKRIAQRGDVIRLGPDVRLRVLFPPADLKRSSADDKAFVLRLETPAGSALFMSDSGFSTERWLMEHEPDLAANVLIKGQHPKDVSGTLDFLARVHPQLIVAAQPAANAAPAFQQWAASVQERGVTLFRQDQHGAATMQLDRDGRLRAESFLGGQIFRSRAR